MNTFSLLEQSFPFYHLDSNLDNIYSLNVSLETSLKSPPIVTFDCSLWKFDSLWTQSVYENWIDQFLLHMNFRIVKYS